MSESDVIKELCENRYKGISYEYLNKETKDYIWEHLDDLEFMELDSDGNWIKQDNNKDWLCSNSVVTMCFEDEYKRNKIIKVKAVIETEIFVETKEESFGENTKWFNELRKNIYKELNSINQSCFNNSKVKICCPLIISPKPENINSFNILKI